MKQILLMVFFGLTGATLLFAAEDFKIIIKNHQFEPSELTIPANKKVKLIVENQDSTAEEFESHDLNREKIIAGGKSATIFLDSLKPGTYKYVGEFNEEKAKGTIIAK